MPFRDRLLIIGNGFDLAHGLPTRYSDFLEFGERFLKIYSFRNDEALFKEKILSDWNCNEKIKGQLKLLFDERKMVKADPYNPQYSLGDDLDSLHSLLKKNIWFGYFCELYHDNKMGGVNWIDFEFEISTIIQWMDEHNDGLNTPYFSFHEAIAHNQDNEIIGRRILFYQHSDLMGSEKPATVGEFFNILYIHLENLTKALNIYLYKFVEPLIDGSNKIKLIEDIKPTKVLSFNYTHTFNRIYDSTADICYIHGECGQTSDNMVLGIGEYQDNFSRNAKNDMAVFKKFVQRNRKKNDLKLYQWQDKFQTAFDRQARARIEKSYYDVHIFGHSMDVTDADILELFLKPEFSSLHIYAYNEDDENRKFANMIRIMSEKTYVEKSRNNRLETRIV